MNLDDAALREWAMTEREIAEVLRAVLLAHSESGSQGLIVVPLEAVVPAMVRAVVGAVRRRVTTHTSAETPPASMLPTPRDPGQPPEDSPSSPIL